MCDLFNDLKANSVIGFKVVAKSRKTGKYFSPATGIEYIEGEDVQIPIKQERIGEHFKDTILDPTETSFRKTMVGRTGVFLNRIDAINLQNNISIEYSYNNYDIIIVKMTLSKELMEGKYGSDSVYAGKHIDKIEEENV